MPPNQSTAMADDHPHRGSGGGGGDNDNDNDYVINNSDGGNNNANNNANNDGQVVMGNNLTVTIPNSNDGYGHFHHHDEEEQFNIHHHQITKTKVATASNTNSNVDSDDNDHNNELLQQLDLTDMSGHQYDPRRHDMLRKYPLVWSTVGVTQTLLTSGIIFGWASLLPVLRDVGVPFTTQQFAIIFTAGAIGNYMTTLVFGLVLDYGGPKITGIVASILYAIGLILCSFVHSYQCFSIGFFMIGFAGPGIQMPTLHLANLFGPTTTNNNNSSNEESDKNGSGGSGGSALYMSCQAAAFDGGTAIFAIVRLLYQLMGFTPSTFFLVYLIVPVWSFCTALFVWPDTILPTPGHESHQTATTMMTHEEEYLMSPYQSPSSRRSMRSNRNRPNNLINAPLSHVLRHPAFWSLASWAGIHILKLNFVVATINDQLNQHVSMKDADHLIDLLGAMLPFGFVALPIVATLLDKAPIMAFELANIIGLAYGAIMTFIPGFRWAQSIIVFPSVACSRQLVYSTLFHQVGATFGFVNYGVLLGLINVIVSLMTTIQTPLVSWSEQTGSYYWANLLLWIVTVPLFVTVLYSDPTKNYGPSFRRRRGGGGRDWVHTERTTLLPKDAAFEYDKDDPNMSMESRKSVVSLR